MNYYERIKKDRKFKRKVFSIKNPYQVTWNITYKCNLKCIFCALPYVWKYTNYNPSRELKLVEIEKIIEELATFGVKEIFFTGGEPLLRSDFFKILHCSVRSDINTSFVTNGTLITKNMAKRIVMSGVREVMVSIDGHSSTLHDQLRNSKGAFKKTINGIKNLVEARKELKSDVLITTNTVLLRQNITYLLQIGKLILSLNVDKINIQPFYPFTASVKKYSVANLKDVRIIHKFKRYISRKLPLDEEYVNEVIHILTTGKRKWDICLNPCVSCYITYDGTVTPCCFLSERIAYDMGNLRKESIRKIWNRKNYRNFRMVTLERLVTRTCQSCTTLSDIECMKFLEYSLKL